MRRLYIGASLLLVIILMALVYVERAPLYDTLRGLKLVPIEEPVTELYFNDIDKLPTRAGALTFSFTIHNLEGKDMVYPYRVVAALEDGRQIELDQSTIPIAAGDASSIPESPRVQTRTGARIIVELPEQNQHISFLIH